MTEKSDFFVVSPGYTGINGSYWSLENTSRSRRRRPIADEEGERKEEQGKRKERKEGKRRKVEKERKKRDRRDWRKECRKEWEDLYREENEEDGKERVEKESQKDLEESLSGEKKEEERGKNEKKEDEKEKEDGKGKHENGKEKKEDEKEDGKEKKEDGKEKKEDLPGKKENVLSKEDERNDSQDHLPNLVHLSKFANLEWFSTGISVKQAQVLNDPNLQTSVMTLEGKAEIVEENFALDTVLQLLYGEVSFSVDTLDGLGWSLPIELTFGDLVRIGRKVRVKVNNTSEHKAILSVIEH